MDENLRWEKLEDKIIRKDRWVGFREATYRMPNGNTVTPFYHYTGRDFVVIAAIDRQGKYIRVRQSRVGIDEATIEFPVGGTEAGETPRDAARRELREETGSVVACWTDLGSLYANPTMGTSRTYCFLAEDCEAVIAQEFDTTECVVYLYLGESELRRAIEDGSFAQAVHLVLYYRAKELREGRWVTA